MSKKVLKWLILIALLLLIVSFFSFWFSGSSFRDKDVNLQIEGPTQATVGEEVVYKLKYSNNTKLKLYDMKFTFSYPQDSVVIEEGIIQTDLHKRFSIDELGSGEKGEREFRAFIVGNKGDTKEAKVDLSFKAGDLRSLFEKRTTLSTTITSVPLALTIVAPPNVIPGQTVDYILDYRNESDNPVSDLLFEFNFPEGFVPSNSTPEPESPNKWHIDSLKKGGAGRISIRGILNGQEGETKTIQVVLKRKINDKYVDFQKASSFSILANPLLSLSILANGSTNYSANPGDELNYAIDYKNNSDFSLSGLMLSVKLDGNMYDLSTLDTKGGFFDSSSRTITWGPTNVSNFSDLKPGATGRINFYIRLKPDFNLQGSSTLFVKSSVKLSTPNVPAGMDGSEISASANLVTNITKQPTLTQDINSIGENKFTIKWLVANPGNALNNAVITATLSEGASWDKVFSSNVSLGEPKFDNKTRKITWEIGTIPTGTGGLMPKYELQFQVSGSLSPSDLLKNVELSGVDSVTKQSIIVR